MRFDLPYQPPPAAAPGIDLDLSRNEGRPPDRAILEEIGARPGIFNRYPDATDLRNRIAAVFGIEPDNVLVTAGGDDALLRSCSALIEPGGRVVTTTPTFEMVPRYAGLRGADLVEIPWKREAFPTSAMLEAAAPGAICIVVSPNNPTGGVIGAVDLADMAGAYDHVVLDCAYTEFADVDLTQTALGLANVLIIRTLSKAWGLAGLRVGYLLGDGATLGRVAAHGNPYPVSGLSLAIAASRIGSSDVSGFVTRIRFERESLTNLLERAGLRPIPSQANFVFAETERASLIQEELARSGIAIRLFPGRPGLENALRITLPGDEADYARLVRSLGTVLDSAMEEAS